uniref:AROF n=1 Tax=Arundo donax TaxID=35708 RepID=A0A0A9HGG3_ARUDO
MVRRLSGRNAGARRGCETDPPDKAADAAAALVASAIADGMLRGGGSG